MELNTQSLSSLLNHLPLSPPSLLPLSPPSPQAQRQQRLRSGLGQDGGAVAERERGGGAEESTEDDATTVSQPHDREHPHVDRRRRHAPPGRNGPIGHAGGRRHTPPTQLHPLYCFSIWITLHLLSPPHPTPPHPSALSYSRCNSRSPLHLLHLLILWLQFISLLSWFISTPFLSAHPVPNVSPPHLQPARMAA